MSQTPYPKQLNKSDFIDAFGSIYEHSPWVAESIYQTTMPGVGVESIFSIKNFNYKYKINFHNDFLAKINTRKSSSKMYKNLFSN